MWSRVCVHDGEKKCVTVASNTYECMAQAVCVCEDQFMCLYEMICTREWEASAAYRNIAAMAGSRASNGSKCRKKEITTNETRSIYIDINETGAHAHNSPAIYYTIEYFAGLFFFFFIFLHRSGVETLELANALQWRRVFYCTLSYYNVLLSFCICLFASFSVSPPDRRRRWSRILPSMQQMHMYSLLVCFVVIFHNFFFFAISFALSDSSSTHIRSHGKKKYMKKKNNVCFIIVKRNMLVGQFLQRAATFHWFRRIITKRWYDSTISTNRHRCHITPPEQTNITIV